ncbi:unnamed protein product [Meloidogyne enterolobii]|uniref:Uncharacterized protein n=1 Tax=Meloidogyne enterolobii TaxID=390850 RepID=A0ACB0Z965_MELEN
MHEEEEEGEEEDYEENGELIIDEDERPPRPLSAPESEVDVMGEEEQHYLLEEKEEKNIKIEEELREELKQPKKEVHLINDNHSNGYDPLRLLSSAAAAEHEQIRKMSQ